MSGQFESVRRPVIRRCLFAVCDSLICKIVIIVNRVALGRQLGTHILHGAIKREHLQRCPL